MLSGGEVVGDSMLKITGAASLSEATAGEISFFTNRKYIQLLRKTRASAIIVPPDFVEQVNASQIRVSNPAKAFEQVVLKFAPKPITFTPGTHPSAIVDPSVQLGERVSIQPLAVIEAGVKIGDDTIIGAGSYVGHETVIGSACHIYPHEVCHSCFVSINTQLVWSAEVVSRVASASSAKSASEFRAGA